MVECRKHWRILDPVEYARASVDDKAHLCACQIQVSQEVAGSAGLLRRLCCISRNLDRCAAALRQGVCLLGHAWAGTPPPLPQKFWFLCDDLTRLHMAPLICPCLAVLTDGTNLLMGCTCGTCATYLFASKLLQTEYVCLIKCIHDILCSVLHFCISMLLSASFCNVILGDFPKALFLRICKFLQT